MYERILENTKKISLILIALVLVILLVAIGVIHQVTGVPALAPQKAALPEEVRAAQESPAEDPASDEANLNREGDGFAVIIDGKAAGQVAGQE
ncbi:hypothetical protein [Kallipyga massiliensis]|uniref:hypothetical protein n=1 Tax=Kallipyga massiliensis TaxID=1472764 RepID=UPI0026EC9927|nr:hypothetical protein [Kallipyga massiliensis]